jgi:hypothetical protein
MADLALKGLEWLAEQHPDARVVLYDKQPETWSRIEGPWVCIDFVCGPTAQVSRYAIWKATGNVYLVGDDGAVEDDPIYEVTPLGVA